MNLKALISLGLFIQANLLHADIKIRSFDLGGGGMKTARFVYYQDTQQMHLEDVAILCFPKCPDDQEVADWIRAELNEHDINLDQEAAAGFRFGFSLAGLGDKLRVKPVETRNIAELFRLPQKMVFALHDGEAHALASYIDVGVSDSEVWNFALGTAIGLGVMHQEKVLFLHCPLVQEIIAFLMDKEVLARECTPHQAGGFSQTFIENWVSLLGHLMKEKKPSQIIFTGKFIDLNGSEFLEQLRKTLDDSVIVKHGPNNAGLYGAALSTVYWNTCFILSSQLGHPHMFIRSSKDMSEAMSDLA